MKKIAVYRVVSAVFLLVSIVLGMFLYLTSQSNEKMREELASRNLANWNSLFSMTETLEGNIHSPEDIPDFSKYQNAVLYTVSDQLQPVFEGKSTKTLRFLPASYDPLMQELASADDTVEEALLNEGMALYLDINAELKAICDFVVTSSEENANIKYELLDSQSDFSRQVQKLIDDFCEQNGEELEAFFKEWNAKVK